MESPLTLGLITLNVIASLAAFGRPEMLRDGMLAPYEIVREGKWYQTISSGFLHADIGHLFMNLFTLFFFGPEIEHRLGPARFLVIYFGAMLAGSLLAVARHKDQMSYRALGASGAVSGVLFAFVLYRPFAKIQIFLIPIGIPAVLFAVGYVAISLWGMKTRIGGIGHDAHLGGALGGMLLTALLDPRALPIFLSHFD